MRDQGQVAVRFGVKANPPTLVVEYASRQQGLMRPSRKEDGLRHKVLRLHHLGLSEASSCDKVLLRKQAPHSIKHVPHSIITLSAHWLSTTTDCRGTAVRSAVLSSRFSNPTSVRHNTPVCATIIANTSVLSGITHRTHLLGRNAVSCVRVYMHTIVILCFPA